MAQWSANPAGEAGDGWSDFSEPAPTKSKESVPDDWEADGDNEDDQAKQKLSQQLWEEANARDPQPKVILTSTAGSSTPNQIPDSLLNAPKMILKRPTSSPASSSPSPSALSQKSIQEREASYQAARERIFGSSSPVSDGAPTNIIRSPRGPPTGVNPAIVSDSDEAPAVSETVANAPTGFAGRVQKKKGHGRTVSDLEGIKLGSGAGRGVPPAVVMQR